MRKIKTLNGLISVALLLGLLAGPVQAESIGALEGHGVYCSAIESGELDELREAMAEDGYTIEDHYFGVHCGRHDIMGMVIENAEARAGLADDLLEYFTEELDSPQPKVFSRILLHEIDSKHVLRRLHYELLLISDNPSLVEAHWDTLLDMMDMFIAHLERHPYVGEMWMSWGRYEHVDSHQVVKEAKVWLAAWQTAE